MADQKDNDNQGPGAGDKNAADDDATEISGDAETVMNADDDATVTDTDTDTEPTEIDDGDFTEYQATHSTTATGFDQARAIARDAQRQTGRLLKKRFVLEEILGRGGMGVVYKARDLRKVEAEDSNPYIAAKVLSGNFKDHPHAFVTLQQEAVKSQRLAHPNIVTVYDFDRDGDTIFMTMELLKGDPMDGLLNIEKKFSKETAMRYFKELCAGLEYAHKRGLIHSDFKPGNIFVTAGGQVKILDFGIARAASRESQSHTFDAGDLGALTPAYATIEMVNREPPSFSDDVYALACVMYLMLTGEHPFNKLSAADAKAQKLKARKPDCLNAREWQALSEALQFDKNKRTGSIEAFRSAMLPAERSPMKMVIGAAVVVLAIAGWLGFRQYQAASAQQATVVSKLQAAKDCFYQSQFDCAVENARIVTNLVPDHPEATQLLQAASAAAGEQAREARIETQISEAQDCMQQQDYACARVHAREALELDDGNPLAQRLLDQAEEGQRQQSIGGFLSRAETCLDRGDTACADLALEEASAAGAGAADLYPLQKRRDDLLAQQQATLAQQQAQITSMLKEARECLDRSDFDCSEDRAGAVLALDAANTEAIEIRQATGLARSLREANERTVASFLREAESCMQKKNYSCAIAKADSALAIIPGHRGASAMRNDAVQAQRSAKKSISIE